MTAVNVDVTKGKNENDASLMRRFSRKARSANIVRTVRNSRFFERRLSKLTRKSSAITRIEKTKTYEMDKKLGKRG